tara:strand:+ start:604 stop:906 length:303 start_codon:yes stop_codon:yes gene_type:complete
MDIHGNEMPEWTMKEKDGSELSDYKKTVLKNMWVQTALLKAIAEKINIREVLDLNKELHSKLHENTKTELQKAIYDHKYEGKNHYDAAVYKKFSYDEEDE